MTRKELLELLKELLSVASINRIRTGQSFESALLTEVIFKLEQYKE